MKKLIILFIFITHITLAQSRITVKANFNDVVITQIIGSAEQEVGVGSAEVRLSKKDINKFKFSKEGYETVIKSFPRTLKWQKIELVNLTTRVVKINASPFDAELFIDGKSIGTKSAEIKIPEDKEVTLEVKKEGFATVTKKYYNKENQAQPPITDEILLEDREVNIKVNPLDSDIIVDKQIKGMGSRKVTIPKGKCVLVEAVKEGYTGDQKAFCNKEGEFLPINHNFLLEDRLVNLTSAPKDAEIVVKGKVVGIGNYNLKVPKNKCVEVEFKKESFINTTKNYCNRSDYQKPPLTDFIELMEDEAYATSISTDLANVRFTVAVREGISELDAWKVLSQIITTEFDVIEVTDKETGYLRTAWQVQTFNGNSTIRTRVIVNLIDAKPLKYGIKINSERADGAVSAKEDQKFSEWNRILKKYNNIIEEAQTRL